MLITCIAVAVADNNCHVGCHGLIPTGVLDIKNIQTFELLTSLYHNS